MKDSVMRINELLNFLNTEKKIPSSSLISCMIQGLWRRGELDKTFLAAYVQEFQKDKTVFLSSETTSSQDKKLPKNASEKNLTASEESELQQFNHLFSQAKKESPSQIHQKNSQTSIFHDNLEIDSNILQQLLTTITELNNFLTFFVTQNKKESQELNFFLQSILVQEGYVSSKEIKQFFEKSQEKTTITTDEKFSITQQSKQQVKEKSSFENINLDDSTIITSKTRFSQGKESQDLKNKRQEGSQEGAHDFLKKVDSEILKPKVTNPQQTILKNQSTFNGIEDYLQKKENQEEKRFEETRYHIVEVLGEGGMGIVELVQDKILEREVALKKIKFLPGTTKINKTSEEMLSRFKKEAKITAILEHPNIVPIYDYQHSENGETYFTMQKVEGKTLREILVQKRTGNQQYDEAKLLSIYLKVCDAVAYAHSKKVIHRDLKPTNIMVGKFGEVYVMDWGIAKQLDKEGITKTFQTNNQQEANKREQKERAALLDDTIPEFTPEELDSPPETTPASKIFLRDHRTTGGIGTRGYMSPEQAKEANQVTKHADIFALGKILRECCTLLNPLEELKKIREFHQESFQQKQQIANKKVHKNLLEKNIPKDILAIINKATTESWEDRYSTVEQLILDLECYQKKLPVSVRNYNVLEKSLKWGERNSKTLMISLLFFCTAMSLSWWYAGEKAKLAKKEKKAKIEARLYAKAEKTAKESAEQAHAKAKELAQRNANLAEKAERRLYISLAQKLILDSINETKNGNIERGKLLIHQAFLFNKRHNGHLANQIDAVLRSLMKQSKTTNLLSEETSSFTKIAFSSSGRYLAAGNNENKIKLWDMKQPDRLLAILNQQESEEITCLEFSPNELFLAAGSSDKTIKIWDLTNPWEAPKVLPHGDEVQALSISHDSQNLISGDWSNRIYLWDLKTNMEKASKEQESLISSLSFSPTEAYVVAGFQDGSLHFISTPSLTAYRQPIQGHQLDITALSFSPDGQTLLSTSIDGAVKLWTNLNQTEIKENSLVDEEKEWISAAWSSNGKKIALIDTTHEIRLYSPDSPLEKPEILTKHSKSVLSIAFHPTAECLASVSEDKTLRLWNLSRALGKPLKIGNHKDKISSLEFAPKKNILVSGSLDQTIKIWDLQKPEIPITEYEISTLVNQIRFHPTKNLLTAALGDGSICLINEMSKIPSFFEGTPLTTEIGGFYALAYNSDGTLLATAGGAGLIYLWDMTSPIPKVISTWQAHPTYITSLLFHPTQNELISAGEDSNLQLWNLQNLPPTLKKTIAGHQHAIRSLSLSSDKRSFISGSWDRTIKQWDFKQLENNPLTLKDKHPVSSVALSPKGQFLASCGRESKKIAKKENDSSRAIRLWNIENSTADPNILKKHQFPVSILAFSPDGNWLASGDEGKPQSTIYLWPTSQKMVATISKDSIRNLTLQEWWKFLGTEIPYEKTFPHLKIQLTVIQEALLKIKANGIENALELFHQDIEEEAKQELAKFLLLKAEKLSPQEKISNYKNAILLDKKAFLKRANFLAVKEDLLVLELLLQQAKKFDPSLPLNPQVAAKDILAQCLVQKGEELAKQGKLSKAIQKYRQAKQFNPELKLVSVEKEIEVKIYLNKAEEQSSIGNLEGAIKFYRQAKTLFPSLKLIPEESAKEGVARYYLKKAKKHALQGKMKQIVKALLLLEKAKKLNPVLVAKETTIICSLGIESLRFQGRKLAKKGELKAAIEYFTKAVELNKILGKRAKSLPEPQKETNEIRAKKLLKEEVQELIKAQEIEKLLILFHEIIALDESIITARDWNTLCWYGSLVLHHNKNIVRKAGEKAVSMAPTDGNMRDTRGVNLILNGELDAALEDFAYYAQWEVNFEDSLNERRNRKKWLHEIIIKEKNPFQGINSLELLNQLKESKLPILDEKWDKIEVNSLLAQFFFKQAKKTAKEKENKIIEFLEKAKKYNEEAKKANETYDPTLNFNPNEKLKELVKKR